MTPKEAAAVLAKAGTFDNRQPSEQAAFSWAQALADVPLRDALEAVVDHYRATRQWIMPDDIRRRVEQIRADRVAQLPAPVFDPDLDPTVYRAAVREWTRLAGEGTHPDAATAVQAVSRRQVTA